MIARGNRMKATCFAGEVRHKPPPGSKPICAGLLQPMRQLADHTDLVEPWPPSRGYWARMMQEINPIEMPFSKPNVSRTPSGRMPHSQVRGL